MGLHLLGDEALQVEIDGEQRVGARLTLGAVELAHVTPPLGFVEPGGWRGNPLRFAGDWALLLYTDGLIDGRIGEGSERLGERRLVELLAGRGAADVDRLADAGPLLDEIVAKTRAQLEERKRAQPIERLIRGAPTPSPRRSFAAALARGGRLNVIAEFKRRSPSAGAIAGEATVAEVVSAYERGGAAALSVLTDERNFGGTLDDLRALASFERTGRRFAGAIVGKAIYERHFTVAEALAAAAG